MGLGAICELVPTPSGARESLTFAVSEFAALEDGRRVVLHHDRGFSLGPGRAGPPAPAPELWAHETPESLTRDVLTTVLPDGDDPAEDHPWSRLAERARARGLEVTADDLRGLPYEVVLTDAIRRRLAPD